MFYCFLHQASNALLIADVDADTHGAAAEVVSDFLRKRLVQVGDDGHGALPIQCFGNALAETLSASGDDRNFSAQSAGDIHPVIDILFFAVSSQFFISIIMVPP